MAKVIKRGSVYYSDLRMGGKRIRRALDTDRRIAEGLLADLIKERNSRKRGRTPENYRLDAFLERYWPWAEANKHKGTLVHERSAFRWLQQVIPTVRLSEITPELLDRVKTKWKESGRKVAVMNRQIRAIKTVLRRSEVWGIGQKQDWASVGKFKEPRGRLHFFDEKQYGRLLRNCYGQWKTVALLAGRAGLRRGEIHWLEWTDVDFARNRVHIAAKEGWMPKDNERRWVSMPPSLRSHLLALSQRKHGRWVVEDAESRPTLGTLTTYFRRLVKKAGLTGGIHTLRHTFAAHLAMKGYSLYKLAAVMGHSDPRTTQIYAHLTPESTSDTATLLP